MPSLVAEKLEQARQELLDLSFRNTLINFRRLSAKGVNVIDELPEEVFRILVREGRRMSFLPSEASDSEEEDRLLAETEEETDGPADRHVDTKLQTPYAPGKLQKRLLTTYYAARTQIEEQGVNVLYLALGMLKWYESESSDIVRQAPLILVPVELERTSARSAFRLVYLEEDIGSNLSLRAKLKAEYGIELPDLPDDVEDVAVGGYFDKVDKEVASLRRWHVDRCSVELGFFSFGKFLMFNDLDPKEWPDDHKPWDHSVITSLLEDGFGAPDSLLDEDAHLDEHLDPADVHHVMDADSTQVLAMLDIKQGHHLVIQGPPGTGKSQTIANVIAEAIGQGKDVLFVSEKMAALEVVKRRLDAVHLGDACLELHSHKTRKKDVLAELERTLNLGKPLVPDGREDLERLVEARDRLNAYCDAVNSAIGKSGVSPYRAYGRILHISDHVDVELPKIDDPDLDSWSGDDYRRRLSLAERIQAQIRATGTPAEHPFWGSRLMLFLPSEKESVLKLGDEAMQAVKRVDAAGGELASALELPTSNDPKGVHLLCRAARKALEAPELKGVDLSREAWSARREQLDRLLEAGSAYADVREKHADVLIEEAWSQDVLEVRQHLAAHGEKWYRIFISDFRGAKNRLAGLCASSLPKEGSARLELVDGILQAQRQVAEIEKFADTGAKLFGVQFEGAESDWRVLAQIAEWVIALHESVEQGELPKGLLQFLGGGPDLEKIRPLMHEAEEALEAVNRPIDALTEKIDLDAGLRWNTDGECIDQSFDDLYALFGACIESPERLQEMVTFNHLKQAMKDDGLELLLNVAVRWPHAGEHLVDALAYSWYASLIEKTLRERPILASFEGSAHQHTVDKFRELDRRTFQFNQTRLAKKHWDEFQQLRYGAAGQVGVLRHEFQKKRRHLPIRQLIDRAGGAIQTLKPIFMMSPMSIATYVPPASLKFDLVVFDEASQVKPVDAFGAILRGDQVVVVGDNKQLPPTSFFDSMTVDEDVETAAADVESILGLFNAQGACERMLRYHYRSRHESLIAVSNEQFYDNRLVVFPSPDNSRSELGIRYHHLADTAYDRGGTRTNKDEAHAVAEAAMQHARSRPDWTLGIAAFSQAQAEAIQTQLEILRRRDPSYESFFQAHPEEPFFIKNLENVQGDERDVIYISIGYGKDANGRLSMGFGPLNRDGGERRLNVLITRARRRCEVFTNLQSNDIRTAAGSPRGVVALKRYLQYAENGTLAMASPSGEEADSFFEEVVAKAVRAHGYAVDHQIGSAGFFVDLAVVDPENEGRYLLGVECDGGTYHSARAARDRDRTRQSVLEGLGWQIHRIWSTDWFRYPERETRKVLTKLEALKAGSASALGMSGDGSAGEVYTLQREEGSEDDAHAHVGAQPYQMTDLQPLSFNGIALHEVSAVQLAQLFADIVKVESPIHFDDAARRIMDACGVSRLGNRIRSTFERAAAYAVHEGAIKRQHDFLYDPNQQEISVRDRSGADAVSKNIDYIAPEEIAAAIKHVVKHSIGIDKSDLAAEACYLLGFKRATTDMCASVDAIRDKLLSGGQLEERNGHLFLATETRDTR